MNRWFNDVDVRLTNTSIKNVSLTAYGTIYNEDEQNPNVAAVEALNPETSPSTVPQALQQPIDYHKSTAGMRGTWRPWGCGYDQGGLAITGSYEYCDLDRTNAIYAIDPVIVPTPNPLYLDESHTITDSFQIGPDYRWSSCFDTYLHYKFQYANQPLIGANRANQTASSTVPAYPTPIALDVFDTLLPQYDHIVELGFNWFPCDWFIFNACLGLERGDNHTQYANFDEENYPMTVNFWYAVSDRWSLSAGYSVYSNFVGQDISLADQTPYTGSASALPPVTSKWNYGGQAHVVTVGSRYALTERMTLTGQFEWVRGNDLIYDSYSPATGQPGLGTYSQVLNETTRVSLGADWKVRPRMVVYTRYELYNFNDVEPGYQTGLAQGILGGFSALF
jgi:predicted porin